MGALGLFLRSGSQGGLRKRKGMQRVRNEDDEDDDVTDDDGSDDDDDENGDEGDGNGDDDDEVGGDDDEEGSDDVEKAIIERPESVKTFVALADQVHSIVVPLGDIDSWAALSQGIHETCEEGDVPELPAQGIMHIVLNVAGKTVPVTASTPLEELWKAKAIKVSITDEAQEQQDGPRRNKSKKGMRKGRR